MDNTARRRNGGHTSANQVGERFMNSKQDTRQSLTLTWREVPSWMQDNEYILSGYRRQQNSVLGCMHSIFAYTHNETVNIHTHLWGAVLFIFFLTDFYRHMKDYDSVNFFDITGFVIFLLCAVFCLIFSSLYHTLSCHSEKVHHFMHVFDYAGIVILTVGSFFPCIYYAFYCKPHFQAVYLSGISVAGGAASYVVLSPQYAKPTHRGARTKVFIMLGLCGVLPISHAMFSNGLKELFHEMGFAWIATSGALYILGALIYANRVPERFLVTSANRFIDKWSSSHQIFHVHVVLAALAHYICLLKALHYRHGTSDGLCLP